MSVLGDRKLRLADRYELEEGGLYLSGLQALVRILIDQRRLDERNGLATATLVSGYEGSPLAGYDLELQRQAALLEQNAVVFRPAVNEELAANAVQGSQLASASPDRTCDGVVGVWYGKAPGLDRATDALRHGNLGGAHATGGVLVLVGDDSIAKSSTVPSSSELAMAEVGMPVLAPADSQDVLDLGLHGIAMSRFCGLWTGVKLATNVVDGAASVRVGADRLRPVEPDRVVGGSAFTHEVSAHFLQPNLGRLESSLTGERLELARRYAHANHLNVIEGDRRARVGVVAAGATYLDVRQALRTIGIGDEELGHSGVRVLKLGMVSPLEPRIVEEFAGGLDEIVVVEEKRAFIELALKDQLYGRPEAPLIGGRRSPSGAPMFRTTADLPADLIAGHLAPRILAHVDSPAVQAWLGAQQAAPRRPALLPIAARTPYYCSGCPHNRSTQAPAGSLVGAGIGCHALAALMPSERFGDVVGLSQMGGEGGSWVGMAPFVTQRHLIQNMGDGTFHHSGSLAIRQAVAARARITFKLLHNGTVAMTGGQQATGRMPVPDIAAELLAEGVRKIVITTDDPRRYRRVRLPKGVKVRHRDRLAATQEELAAIDGVTVLIHDQECATELRRKRKRGLVTEPAKRVLINERVCEGCGDCGATSNCLSVQPVDTEFGRKTRIHQASCNKDYSCVDGDCPSFITVRPGSAGRRNAGRRNPGRRNTGRRETGNGRTADAIPEPVIRVRTDDFNMRITGVGGTGVVTVAQVISTAATMAGLHVRSLDQLGMAQKGGAVVSDIRLSPVPFTGANKVAPGQCDLYLGCDLLVAADSANLTVTSPDRTIAVTSTAQVPTGAMVTDTAAAFPDVAATVARIHGLTRAAHGVAVDARAETSALLGDDQFANVFLVGAAVQAGALPVPPRFVEEALELNGVAVGKNIEAFRAGRRHVTGSPAATAGPDGGRDPVSATAQTILSDAELGDNAELFTIAGRRTDELIAYQDRAYAEQFAANVRAVAAAERTALGAPGAVTDSYARRLFKLMAYKDEYEVARLSLDPALDDTVAAQFGEGARYYYHLHPPVLRAVGLKKKISLGPWFRPVFRLLYAGRRLRGTPLDVFGHTEVRRTERALAAEYHDAVVRALPRLSPGTEPALVALAGLPDMVRGYEHIKLGNVGRYRAALAAALSDIERPAPVAGGSG